MTSTDAPKTPAIPLPEHDLTASSYDRHASNYFGAPNWLFDSRCRRCWYNRALADLAPLHRQMVEACAFALKLIDRPDAPDEGASPIVVLVRQQLRAAVDAARKAGW